VQNLVDGVHFFQNVGFRQYEELFGRLATGQTPEACFITCADSRVDPNLITNARPGQLFIVRNVGNLVPCHGVGNNAEAAAVEFAIEVLGVRDVILCGHTQCGAMRGLLEPGSLKNLPHVKKWLRHAGATRAIIREHYQHLGGEALLTASAEENVLVQLEHLRTLPAVAKRLVRDEVHLHGWMYKFQTGEMFFYDAALRQFTAFKQPVPGAPPAEKQGVG
jgi:carbonic anhydrase